MNKFKSFRITLSKTAMFAILALAVSTARATTYNVGPRAGYLPKLASVPWGGLLPGDTVNIYPQAGGYHELIQISASGTAANPITIRGIADPITGALPVIDGNGAIMDPGVDFRNSIFENLGVYLSPHVRQVMYMARHSHRG